MATPQMDEDPVGGGDAEWLCTFNDLMTLLMVFFVLLFTMSSLPDPRFKNISVALQSGFGVLEAGDRTDVVVQPHDSIPQEPGDSEIPAENTEPPVPETEGTKAMAEAIVRKIEASGDAHGLFLGGEGQIRLGSGLLFETGNASIGADGGRMLDRLAEALQEVDCDFRVEGHTDNLPIETVVFPSNWELSAQRAVNVVKYLVEKSGFAPERFSAAGYGDAKPCASNRTAEGREKNRRVEIVLVERNSHE